LEGQAHEKELVISILERGVMMARKKVEKEVDEKLKLKFECQDCGRLVFLGGACKGRLQKLKGNPCLIKITK
jgi:hypothetical protein